MTGGKFVVAYDGSPGSKKALALAANLAKGLSAKLILIRVLDPARLIDSEINDVAKARAHYERRYGESLATAKEQLAELGDAVTMEVLEGNPAETIIDFAHREQAQMIIVGTRGLGGFKRLMLGSMAQALVTYSDIPVLVAK